MGDCIFNKNIYIGISVLLCLGSGYIVYNYINNKKQDDGDNLSINNE